MWTWKASERTEGLKAGRTYYFLVNVTFDTSGAPENSPILTYGGSALSKFTTK